MKQSENLRYMWLDKHLVTMYAPPQNPYSMWEAIGGLVCIIIIFIALWWGTP